MQARRSNVLSSSSRLVPESTVCLLPLFLILLVFVSGCKEPHQTRGSNLGDEQIAFLNRVGPSNRVYILLSNDVCGPCAAFLVNFVHARDISLTCVIADERIIGSYFPLVAIKKRFDLYVVKHSEADLLASFQPPTIILKTDSLSQEPFYQVFRFGSNYPRLERVVDSIFAAR